MKTLSFHNSHAARKVLSFSFILIILQFQLQQISYRDIHRKTRVCILIKKVHEKGGVRGGEKRRSPTRAVKRSNLHSSVSHRLCQLILVSNHSRKVWSRSRRGKCRDIVQGTFQFRLRCFRRLHSWTDCRWTGHATKIIKFIDSIKFYKMVAWLTSKVHDFFCVHDIRSSIALVLLSGESS